MNTKGLGLKFLAPLFVFLTFLQPAMGTEHLSARALALGGASRGGPYLTDAIVLNPSFVSYLPMYALSGTYHWADQGRTYNASVMDARNELFQAGVSFTRREWNNAINLGASRQVVERVGVGLGSKMIMSHQGKFTRSDMILSTSYIFSSELQGALILDNLIQSSGFESDLAYRTLYFGLKYKPIQQINIFFDPSYSPSYLTEKKLGYALGIDIGMLADFALRFGTFHNSPVPHLNTRGKGWSWGLGWIGPKLSIDFASHRTIESDIQGRTGTTTSLTASIYF